MRKTADTCRKMMMKQHYADINAEGDLY